MLAGVVLQYWYTGQPCGYAGKQVPKRHSPRLHLVGKGMRRTRTSERLSGGLSPPKIAAALAPDACRGMPAASQCATWRGETTALT